LQPDSDIRLGGHASRPFSGKTCDVRDYQGA